VSGIAGIVNLDGAPVDRRIIARMTESLTLCGPDAQHIWIDGAAGFGHTLFKTTDESEREQQPFTLEGNVWVVADARIDAQCDLLAELSARGREVSHDASDVELIAHAYCIWQEGCVDHLLGDFAFGIWDTSLRRLFCARDHMGVKPFYYASLGQSVVFSNSVDCVRLYPAVSDRLNDLAVADFLLFNVNWDKAKTTFADIERLPPAHAAVWSERGLQLRRYWTLPIDEPIFYAREDDYLDRFKELLQGAVADRLRTPRVSLFMSGGLDSTALAATASRLLQGRSGDSGVRAFTRAFHPDDQECTYASLTAKSLGISIEYRYWDPNGSDPLWYQTSLHTPEPIPYPTDLPVEWAYHRRLALHSRVAFYGEGSDNALRCEWRQYFSYLLQNKLFGKLLYDLYFQTVLHGRLPLPTIPWMARIQQRNKGKMADFPDWFNPAFEKRYQLRTRWEQLKDQQPSPHPIRPIGYGSFGIPQWQAMFEGFQPAYTRSLLEVRHPFLDLSLLRFMLAVPALPWCRYKYILRRAMRGALPDPVLTRPKSPLVNDPWTKHMLELGLPPVAFTPALQHYVDKNRLLRAPASDPARFWVDFRVRSLGYWLRNMHLPEIAPQTVESSWKV
jgi:asparagine synthase (glutamine-hydrolysing)